MPSENSIIMHAAPLMAIAFLKDAQQIQPVDCIASKISYAIHQKSLTSFTRNHHFLNIIFPRETHCYRHFVFCVGHFFVVFTFQFASPSLLEIIFLPLSHQLSLHPSPFLSIKGPIVLKGARNIVFLAGWPTIFSISRQLFCSLLVNGADCFPSIFAHFFSSSR